MRVVLCLFICVALAACTKKNQKVDPDPDEITHSTPAASAPEPEPAPAVAEQPEPLDFSTPEAAVNTFIRGAAQKDVDILSMCFSMSAEKEFAGFAAKEASEKDLNQLAEMMGKASVIQASMKAGGTAAAVEIKMEWEGRSEETINVVLEGEEWKIQGF